MIDLERKAEDRLIDLGLREVLTEEEIAVADPPSRRLRGVLEFAAVAAAILLLLLVPPLSPSGGPAAPDENPDAPRLVFRSDGDGGAEAVAAVLRKRLELAGVEGSVSVGEMGRVTVAFPEDVARVTFDRMKEVLARPGTLELLPVAPADATLRYAGVAAPPGYRWVPEAASEDRRLVEVPASPDERFTSQDLVEVGVERNAGGAGWLVRGRLRPDRAKAFGDFTKRVEDRRLAIVVDGEVVSAPRVMDRLTGPFQISGGGRGGFDLATAEDLALVLGAPPLPAPVSLVASRVPDPVPSERLVVPGERVGPYRLGPVAEGASLEGEPGVSLLATSTGRDQLSLIDVTTDRYRTAEGIGVGSSIADVLRAFGAPAKDPAEVDGRYAYPGITFFPDGAHVGSFHVHYGVEER